MNTTRWKSRVSRDAQNVCVITINTRHCPLYLIILQRRVVSTGINPERLLSHLRQARSRIARDEAYTTCNAFRFAWLWWKYVHKPMKRFNNEHRMISKCLVGWDQAPQLGLGSEKERGEKKIGEWSEPGDSSPLAPPFFFRHVPFRSILTPTAEPGLRLSQIFSVKKTCKTYLYSLFI